LGFNSSFWRVFQASQHSGAVLHVFQHVKTNNHVEHPATQDLYGVIGIEVTTVGLETQLVHRGHRLFIDVEPDHLTSNIT